MNDRMSSARRQATTGQRPAGFTIIELLVAAAVTIILMVLVGQMFTSTTNAVSQGATTSDMIATGRAMGTQIERDASAMVGPHDNTYDATTNNNYEGGFLVIVNRRYLNQILPIPGGGERTNATVRSDELTFIRCADANAFARRGSVDQEILYPNTPESDNTYYNEITGPYARVWYGHARRTRTDGTDGSGTEPTGLGVTNSPDALANEWILARQAMLLAENSPTNAANDLTGMIHLDGAWYNAPRDGDNQPAAALRFNYMGLTDVAEQALSDPSVPSAISTTTLNGIMIGGDPTDAFYTTINANAAQRDRVLWSVALGSITADEYVRRALDYTYSRERLRVNVQPKIDLTQNAQSYAAWQLGQTHGAFAMGVSDFIVEFAADIATGSGTTYAPDGLVDTDGDGHIKWYSNIDVNPASIETTNDTDSWAVPAAYPPLVAAAELASHTGSPAAQAAFVWRHDRFNAHNPPTVTSADTNFCDWPYLIRIRFRMHDRRGQIMSGTGAMQNLDRSHGMWFEHIIRVRRPS